MDEKNRHNITNFWSGFALGITATTIVAYLFGTEKGRSTIKKLLEISEDFEPYLDKIEDYLCEVPSKEQELSKIEEEEPVKGGGLQTIIEKIKSFSKN